MNLVKKVAQNVAISLDYYIFLQLQTSKSSPIVKKSPNLVTLLVIVIVLVFVPVLLLDSVSFVSIRDCKRTSSARMVYLV
jgi:hypothetical protein